MSKLRDFILSAAFGFGLSLGCGVMWVFLSALTFSKHQWVYGGFYALLAGLMFFLAYTTLDIMRTEKEIERTKEAIRQTERQIAALDSALLRAKEVSLNAQKGKPWGCRDNSNPYRES